MNPACTKVYCLHGFLGLPSDWDFLKPRAGVEFKSIDVFDLLRPSRSSSMQDWAAEFNTRVSRESAGGPRVLMGYSMGGRLAMHSLIRNPSLWDAAVLVSASPRLPTGPQTSEELEARARWDESWARRFETDDWETLIRDWEALSVFSGRPLAFPKSERDFNRQDLADALRFWSPALQGDLTSRIAELETPLLWITGEDDRRYVEIARRSQSLIRSLKKSQTQDFELQIVPQAAHRVPWEQPEAFQKIFWGFLDRVLLEQR